MNCFLAAASVATARGDKTIEPQDLYIRIDKRDKTGECRLIVRLPFDEERRESVMTLPPVDRSAPQQNISAVAQAVANHVQDIAIKASRALDATASPISVLLDLRDAGCFAEDWEGAFMGPWFPSAKVTRFIERSDDHVLLPFDLPMSLLMNIPFSDLNSPVVQPEDYQRYYKTHRVTGLDNDELLSLMQRSHFSIVHLRVRGDWGEAGGGRLSVEDETDISTWITAEKLGRATKACKARLLVLHCRDHQSYRASLDVAHRMLLAGGPTVIVIETPQVDPPGLIPNLYFDIVHNTPLDVVIEKARSLNLRQALFLGIGGASVLQISSLAADLAVEAIALVDAATDALSLLQVQPLNLVGLVADESARLRADAQELINSSAKIVQQSFNYASEHGAWVPIGTEKRRQRELAKRLDRLHSATKRVVNVSVRDGDRSLGADELLIAGDPYRLSIQIGRRAEWSVIDGPAAFPDEALQRFYLDKGVELRVVVFKGAFEIAESERGFLLPPPPHESPEMNFDFYAPKNPGRHRLRISIYYEQNLLQSILVRALVTERGTRSEHKGRGIQAEVEYTLSGSLRNIERLPRRSVNLLLNEGDGGTHTLAVKGASIREQFDFTEGEMRSAVTAARDTLFEICADQTSKPPRYRFDNSNRGTLTQLADDTRRLAEIGYMLFTNIVTAKDPAFQKQLLTELGTTGATIQVSAVKSAQYVFPWALVYDHPIVTGGAKLCPDFEADYKKGSGAGYLSQQRCLINGCANKGNTSIVCPSGFWGFKHLVEQPLSVSGKTGAALAHDLVLEIDIQRADRRVPLMMAVSRDLQQVNAHHAVLEVYPEFDLSMREAKVEIGAGLKGMPAGLVYFYCHGGRDKSRTWLGVGRQEKMYASDLSAWSIDWSHGPPLVFINGCHTVDVTPDDLLSFCRVFGYVRAAGIIGTEISVNEMLACYFAEGLLRRISTGVKVGTAMREQRLELLERCNLLGLAYTPYCSSDLMIRFS